MLRKITVECLTLAHWHGVFLMECCHFQVRSFKPPEMVAIENGGFDDCDILVLERQPAHTAAPLAMTQEV